MMRAFNRSRFFFLLLFVIISFVNADGRYSTSAPQEFQLSYLIEVENTGGPAKDLKLEIPIFMTNGLPPYQKLISSRSPDGVKIFRDNHGQTAVYHQARLEKGRSLSLEFNFTFVNYAIDYQLNPYRGNSSVESRYLQPETGIESDAAAISDLARKLTVGCGTQLEKARKLFYYVNQNLEYQRVVEDTHSALRTLQIGKGVCEDFSLAYIALCRASGIPARIVRGYRFNFPDLKFGETDLKTMAHAWVEVNLPGEGWVTVEPTFDYSINGIKTVNYDFFGKIDQSDRHLFFSYIRDNAPSCSWSHEPRNPANLKLSFRTLLRK